jgi:hypothetical protein
MSEELIEIPKNLFIRMSSALIEVEKMIKENSGGDWVEEETALKITRMQQAAPDQIEKYTHYLQGCWKKASVQQNID